MATAVCALGEEGSRAEQRRRRITDAARKLFIANGFHATGMAQLARESGVAIGQIYRDFSAKEDIVAALAENDCSRMMRYEALEAAIAADDSAGVRDWLRDYLDPGDDRDSACMFAEIVAESARNPRIAAIFARLHEQLRAHLQAALAMLAPASALAGRREQVAEAFMTLSIGMFQYGLIAPERPLAPVLDALTRLMDRELADLAG